MSKNIVSNFMSSRPLFTCGGFDWTISLRNQKEDLKDFFEIQRTQHHRYVLQCV